MVVSILDSLGMSSPGAVFILSSFTSSLLSKALYQLQQHVPGNEKWDPDFMIDKDVVEKGALQILQTRKLFRGRYWLCEFHNIRIWQKEIIHRIQGEGWMTQRPQVYKKLLNIIIL
jgi:hypothetical protein